LNASDYAIECLKAAANAGVDVVVLCDTNGGTMPWKIEVKTGVWRLIKLELDYCEYIFGII
jgi:2-isopropylmalate synthase